MPPFKTLEARLEQHRKVDSKTGCWIWTGALSNGYGRATLARPRRQVCVHKAAYEFYVGKVPKGLDLDHLCRNRACFNPAHLEPVTRSVNCSRGDSGKARGAQLRARKRCSKGHLFSKNNTRMDSKGHRVCLKCKKIAWKKWHTKNHKRYNKIRRKRAAVI